MPSGGQHAGETLMDAVKREVAEKLGVEIEAKSLQFVIEGAQGESFYRMDMVFLCDYTGLIQDASIQMDHKQIGYAWINIEDLTRQLLYPSRLRRSIQKLFQGEPTEVYLGNENVGDPDDIE